MKLLRFGFVLGCLVATANLFAATTFNVKQTGTPGVDCDYADLVAALTAVNAGSGDYIINFTDASAATYNIGLFTCASHNLTLQAASAGIVTVNGRLDAAQGGTTLTATNITFSSTDNQWAAVVTYDGATMNNCTFTNVPSGHGIVMNGGGTNTLTNCTFSLISYNAVASAAGNTTLNNCAWNDIGVMIWTESANAGYTMTVNGGTYSKGSGTKSNDGIRPAGGPSIVINDMVLDGMHVALQRDWTSGPGAVTFNRCTIQNTADSMMQIHAAGNAAHTFSITANDCAFVLTPTGPVGIACDTAHVSLNTLNFNRCSFKRPLSAKTGWLFYTPTGFVTTNVKNCVFDGFDHVLVNQATGTATPSIFNVDFCTFVNSNSSLFSQGSSTQLNVTNSIFDASTLYAFDTNGSTVTADHNLINSSAGSYTFGTNRYTGSPAFVNLASGDYHLGTGSAAIARGLATALTTDYYGQTRTMPAGTSPDLGAAEQQTIKASLTVKATGSAGVDCDYTAASDALTMVNSGPAHLAYVVHFIDATTTTYALSPVHTSLTNGLNVTLNADVCAALDGWLSAPGGGGTLAATNLKFFSASQNYVLQSWDGMTLNHCIIGPSADNGFIANGGGTNTLTDCTFIQVTNAALDAVNGNTTANNCHWIDNGRQIQAHGGAADIGKTLVINGGSYSPGSGTKSNVGIKVLGSPTVTVNDLNLANTKIGIQHDGTPTSQVILNLNRCTVSSTQDSIVQWFGSTNATYTANLNANDCLFLLATAGGPTGFNIDAGGTGVALNTLTLNRCIVKRLNLTKSDWAFYANNGYCTVQANTCVFDNWDHPLVNNSGAGVAVKGTINYDYCTFVNSNSALYTQSTGGVLSVTNCLFDSTVSYAVDNASNPNVTVNNNLFLTGSNTFGTNSYTTGVADFINLAGGDYHIGINSAAIRKGLTSSLTLDIYGQTRPMPADTVPDLGAVEEQVVPVELSSFGIE